MTASGNTSHKTTITMYHQIKKKVYLLLHPDEGDTRWDKFINAFLITVIVLNVLAVILETVESIHIPHEKFFRNFDTVSVIIFSIEYALRIWSANYHDKYKHSIKGRLKYIFSLGALVDFIAILPWYLGAISGGFDLRVLRIFRLVRILRLFRLTAYTKSAQMIFNVFKKRINELMLSFILTFFLIIIAACLVYYAEHGHNPQFTSIPATIWWAVVTLTTVGYGEMVPVTLLGKTFSIIIMLSGVALLALPAGIITTGFLEELRNIKKPKTFNCPHCGKPIDQTHYAEDHSGH